MSDKIKAIIPAAGFGTRVGMAHFESKELLPWAPNYQTLIDHKIQLCLEHNLEPLVITRPEKESLFYHLFDKYLGKVEIIDYTPNGDWAQTIHDNRRYFGKENILILPDTIFDDDAIPGLINTETPVAFAVHKIYNSAENPIAQNWGIVYENTLYEKPVVHLNKEFDAWGLIKFDDLSGRKMFKALMDKKYYNIGYHPDLQHLLKFEDVTR